MDTDIKGVSSDEVVVVRPRRDLMVNGTTLKAGTNVTVPADFDLIDQCELVVPEDEEFEDENGAGDGEEEVKEEKAVKPSRRKK